MVVWEIIGIALQHLGNVISIVLVLAILSGRKEARATLGWVLLVVFLPYVGVLAYLVFGRGHPGFSAPREDAAGSCPVPEEDLPEPEKRTMRIARKAPVRCTRLELLGSAREKYDRMEADILAARHRVVMAYYVFRRDGTGRRFLELLARKAAEGVETCLLYDGWGAFGLGVGRFLRPYREAGVRVRAFHPVSDPLKMSRINFRNHRKVVVVDGRIAYTGSTNIGDEYLGLHPRFGEWKDVHVRLEGEAAADLEAVFRQDWEVAGGEGLRPSPPPPEPGRTRVHVLSSGPNEPQESLHALLFAQFAAARESIDILTPYLVPDQGIVGALTVAVRQGARVRVLLPGRSNHPMVAAAGRSYYDELIEEGVELYETPDGMLHAKGILVDGAWALVGSTNLDNRSFHLNFELNLATSDPDFCEALARRFNTWVAGAHPVSAEDLERRPLARRLLEGACRTLSPVL